jgi:predicted MPP superfamily phosphohydrolase
VAAIAKITRESMTAVFLHLSDIHIRGEKDPILNRTKEIASAAYSSLPAASHVFILISGDIAFSGTESEYQVASTFCKSIKADLRSQTHAPISFVMVPGNHDCDFKKSNALRDMAVETLERQECPKIDDSVIEACTSIQSNYFAFQRALEENNQSTGDKLWWSHHFKVEGKSLTFECLNISWVSKIREEPGRLFFPIERYSEKTFEPADVRVVLLHHPLNWFNQSVYRPFRVFVRKLANVVVSGHEHAGNAGIISEVETDTSAFVEGCVLQSNDPKLRDSSFNLIVLDLELGQFSTTKYVWNSSLYTANEEGSWLDYRELPAKRQNIFEIKSEFLNLLEDPGAYIKHPGCANVGLSDIYVFPDLRKVGNGDDRRRIYVSSSKLVSPAVTAGGVLIEGEEKAGCTSLLYRLFIEYHDRGYVPLIVKGREIKRVGESEFDKLLTRAFAEQYDPKCLDAYKQLGKEKKILLLDDFDESPLKSGKARAALLSDLKTRFEHLVVTVGEMFEIREMLDGDDSRSLKALTHYKVQPFGHARREELIQRWLALGADGTVDESTQLGRLDQTEKMVEAVMSKRIIPSCPLYLLTLLQSVDAGKSGDFKESALGYYYQYLLTEALQSSGVKPDKLTELFQYCAHLAWNFHLNGRRDLTEEELRSFNEQFSKRWTTVDFLPRLETLLRARVLAKNGEEYGFRYPYIYYYLKGKYLSENLQDLDIRAYVGRCAQHLYVRDNANTVLFLAHHSNDEFVLNAIAEALHNLFRTRAPVRFEGDTGGINKLVEDAPKLVYAGASPEKHRTVRNKLKDELDDGSDGLLEKEEVSEELSLIAQLTMLTKTTEILGQVLKNQYAKITRSRKAYLLEDLFTGPLRAIRDFFSYFDENPEALIAEIEAIIARKGKAESEEERKTIARKAAANIVQVVTYGLLMRAAQNANSDSLREDVQAVVKSNGSAAFKMIEVGMLLDSPKAIPKSALKHVFGLVQRDVIASRVVQIMVLNHLYMFKTTEQEMQWLSKELKIDLGVQHAITYHEKRQRLAV